MGILDLLEIVVVIFTQRIREPEWEGTVVGRVIRDIWILTSSGEIRYVKTILPGPFGKTLKIGDHLVKYRGILKPEVSPQD